MLKKDQVLPFLQWQTTRNQRALWLFTDGSRLHNSRTGAVWVAFCAGRQIFSRHVGLGTYLEVYNTEARALHQGLQATIAHSLMGYMETIYACLGNQAVAMAMYQHPKGTSATTLQKCKDLIKKWDTRPRSQPSTHLKQGTALVLWVRGHRGILGNKAANKESQRGANLPLQLHSREMSAAGAKQWAREAANPGFSDSPSYCDAEASQLAIKQILPGLTELGVFYPTSGASDVKQYVHTYIWCCRQALQVQLLRSSSPSLHPCFTV